MRPQREYLGPQTAMVIGEYFRGRGRASEVEGRPMTKIPINYRRQARREKRFSASGRQVIAYSLSNSFDAVII